MTAGARRALAAPTVAIAVALLAVGCSGEQPGESAAPSAAPSEPVDMACDTIIPSSFATELRGIGWEAREEPFRIGEHVLDGGIQCIWGDSSSSTDIAQMYGWAPVEAEQGTDLRQYLLDQGWLEENEGDVVYITEDPSYALYVSEDGYGMTYAFHDGWVGMADTKAGLELIVWRG